MSDQSKPEYTRYYLSAGTSPQDAWNNILFKNKILVVPDFMADQETTILLSKKDAEYLVAHGAIRKSGGNNGT